MKINYIIRAIAAFFAALSLGSAFAAEPPAPYVGASFGSGDAGFGANTSVTSPIGDVTRTYDGKNEAYKIYAGYRFNERFAAEGGYHTGSKTTDDVEVTTTTAGGSVTTESSSNKTERDYIFAHILASYPFGDFSPFAKLGYARGSSDLSTTVGDDVIATAKLTLTGLAWGVGAAYKFTESVEVRAEWEQLAGDYDYYSLGLVYSF